MLFFLVLIISMAEAFYHSVATQKTNLFAQSPVMYSTCSWDIIGTFPSSRASMVAVFCLTFCSSPGYAPALYLHWPLRMTRRQCMASMFNRSCWVDLGCYHFLYDPGGAHETNEIGDTAHRCC